LRCKVKGIVDENKLENLIKHLLNGFEFLSKSPHLYPKTLKISLFIP